MSAAAMAEKKTKKYDEAKQRMKEDISERKTDEGDIDIEVGDVHIRMNRETRERYHDVGFRRPKTRKGATLSAMRGEIGGSFDVCEWYEKFVENMNDEEENAEGGAKLFLVSKDGAEEGVTPAKLSSRDVQDTEGVPKDTDGENDNTVAFATTCTDGDSDDTTAFVRTETREKKRSMSPFEERDDVEEREEENKEHRYQEEATMMAIALENMKHEFDVYRVEMEDFRKSSARKRLSLKESMRDVLHRIAANHSARLQALEQELTHETVVAKKHELKHQKYESEIDSLLQTKMRRERRNMDRNRSSDGSAYLGTEMLRLAREGGGQYDDLVTRMIGSCSEDAARAAAAQEWAMDLEAELATAKRENERLRRKILMGPARGMGK